ncbi:MAG: RNA-binding protein [Inquilinaceae bacterium]
MALSSTQSAPRRDSGGRPRRDSGGRRRRAGDGDGAERRCIATGLIAPKAALIRFVVAPDGTLTPDIDAKLPGRGLWVAADRAALDKAVRKGAFARAARMPVTVPEGLTARIEAMLTQRCADILGLARRAGIAVAGFEKAREWLVRGEAAVLIAARDGAPDGRGKLQRLAGTRPVVAPLTAAEMGAAFGRDHAVHAAVGAGGLADRLLVEARRLDGLRRAGPRLDGQTAEAEHAAPPGHGQEADARRL